MIYLFLIDLYYLSFNSLNMMICATSKIVRFSIMLLSYSLKFSDSSTLKVIKSKDRTKKFSWILVNDIITVRGSLSSFVLRSFSAHMIVSFILVIFCSRSLNSSNCDSSISILCWSKASFFLDSASCTRSYLTK